MFATLKHNVETDPLSRKPPLGEKRPTLRLVWENPALSAGTHKEESTVKPDASYGRVLDNYFRDYDPRSGRYMSSDPIGLNGGVNPYLYVDGSPLSFVDPLGL